MASASWATNLALHTLAILLTCISGFSSKFQTILNSSNRLPQNFPSDLAMPKATKRISKPKKAKKPTSVNWGNLRAKKKAAPRRVWKHEGEPIEDVKQVPKGWTANEHDLDERSVSLDRPASLRIY